MSKPLSKVSFIKHQYLAENWFTKTIVAGNFPKQEAAFKNEMIDKCPHCEENPGNIYIISSENDSFGPVGKWAACKACWDAEQEKHKIGCEDCNTRVPESEIIPWTWYDFDYRAGDEPIYVCKDCANKDKHQFRVKKDREERQAEKEYWARRGY